MNPKLISLGTAFPPRSYTQEDVFKTMNYPGHFWSIFRDSQIDQRHFYVDFARAKDMSWQDLCDEYVKGSAELSRRVIHDCLDSRDPSQIGCLVWVSCTNYCCPTPLHSIAGDMGFSKKVYITSIQGMGCEGGYPGLRRAYDFTIATRKPSLVVSVELCSCAFFPEPVEGKADPDHDYEILRTTALFGDGASACLVGYDSDPRHPEIIDFEAYSDSQFMGHLGFIWQDGRLKARMSRQVPKLTSVIVAPPLEAILERNHLKLNDVDHWIVHPGGKAVLDNLRDNLGIPEEKLALSRQVLRERGNLSSVSIGVVGKKLMSKEIEPGERALIVSLGPSMSSGVCLLQWPED